MTDNNQKPLKLHFQRFEFKYLLPEEFADILIPKLLKHMDWDPYVDSKPDKKYQVASLYFDSAGLACYYEKIAGVERRKKLRIRVYDPQILPDTKFYVEIKRKDDAVVIKDRIVSLNQDCHQAIIQDDSSKLMSDRSVEDKVFWNEFSWTMKYNCLKPKLMVIYNRAPLIGKSDKKFRVTFDTDIVAYPADWVVFNNDAVDVNPEKVILEVKYNNILPAWFHDIIKDFQLERIAFSKYCMAIEACKERLLII